jgi:hypothetical protein
LRSCCLTVLLESYELIEMMGPLIQRMGADNDYLRDEV